MRVEIWSDVVCPFCYIGKRRFESALTNFEHRDDVDVVLRSFELDPDAPTEPTEKVPTALARKYGISTEQALANMAGVDQMAAGEGLVMRYGFHPSPFGLAIVVATERGLAGLGFCDAGGEPSALADMRGRWPKAGFVEDTAVTGPIAQRIFDPEAWKGDTPLRVVLIGTDFEVRVWETLDRKSVV